LACGTGMAACFYTMYQLGNIGEDIKVYPTSKEELSLRIDGGEIFFKGKVIRVFETSVE